MDDFRTAQRTGRAFRNASRARSRCGRTTASTNIRVNKTIKLSNLKVGDTVRVFGPMSGSKIAANEVTKGVTDDALAS